VTEAGTETGATATAEVGAEEVVGRTVAAEEVACCVAEDDVAFSSVSGHAGLPPRPKEGDTGPSPQEWSGWLSADVLMGCRFPPDRVGVPLASERPRDESGRPRAVGSVFCRRKFRSCSRGGERRE
jgi:hypothetical protein